MVRKLLLGCCVCVWAVSAVAGVDPAALRQELERIEDLRLLHAFAIQDVHDAKALALYLKGWGGPDRSGEAESLMQEAEDVYGALRGVDSGAMTLQAEADALGADAPSQAQLALLQRARGSVAADVNAFYARCRSLKQDLIEQTKAKAAEKVKWQMTAQPQPWPDAAREADREAGFVCGMSLNDRGFFSLPEAEQDYALAKAAKAGIAFANVQSDAACTWAAIERQPGVFDFGALDGLLAGFAKHKIRVCPMLRTLTGTPPQWHIDKYGDECRFKTTTKDKDGKTKQDLSGINLFHEPTREAFAKFLAAYAAHLKQAGQVDAVYVEGGQAEIEAPVDESQSMLAWWRAWSKSKDPWQTPEAILAAEKPDFEAAAKAEMCREAWLIEYIARVAAGLKAGWPEVRVQTMTSNDDFHRLQMKVSGKSRDVRALCSATANPGTGSTSPASLDLLRSFSGGRWTWAWAMHAGCGATPGASYADMLFHDVSRGAGGPFIGNVMRFRYPASWYRHSDRQLGDFGITAYFLSARRAQELAPIVLNTAPAPAEVAILWSQATRRSDRSWQLFQEALAWGHLLTRISVPHDYIADDAGLAGSLAAYRVLILPNTQSMADAACSAIREWAGRGGSVLGFGAPGLFDENGNRRRSLPLKDVFGADIARMRVPGPVTPDRLETTHSEGSFTFGNPPPRPYKFETNLAAALKVAGRGTARAWFAGEEKDVAIAENTYGGAKSMLCGFPLGFDYWESATYELTYGLTHSRHSNYNLEQKRYEAWVLAELGKLGVKREVTLPQGQFLRAQRGDDPDWTHAYRNGPEYSEYMFEEEQPVRTVVAYCRKRDANTYVGLSHTEGNYFTSRGFFRCTLTGAMITASVAAQGTPVVLDARWAVPVPAEAKDGRVTFRTWLPLMQCAAFAIAPDGNVRLFGSGPTGGGTPSGINPDDLAKTAAGYAAEKLAEVEVLDADAIAAFLEKLKGTAIVVGCGDGRFKPVADALAAWLKQGYQVDSRVTTEGPRGSCRFDYMDSFGWTWYAPDPVEAAILIGNCQDNGLMWKFAKSQNPTWWLPLEVNQNFPGMGHCVLMLSSPVISDGNGNIARKDAPRQLVIGASFPSEAMRGLQALQQLRK